MLRIFKSLSRLYLVTAVLAVSGGKLYAQTDIDALMMPKNKFCGGATYGYSSWTNYWEGRFKRNNANLGRVSTQDVMVMGNYGITDKLNVLVGLPYIKTKASQGTLHGQKGLQDLGIWLKWMGYEKKLAKGIIGVYAIGGYSFPSSNYVADLQPVAIGMRNQNLTGRLMVDYQYNDWFVTVSGSYVARANIKIDRDAYYTTSLHQTNEVDMPDAAQLNARAGYRSDKWIVEGVFNLWRTLGGYDISKNNMPFPSNRMNMSTAGINLKYVVTKDERLSLVAAGTTTISGRNVGQATGVSGGVFYILDFSHSKKQPVKANTTN